ncbi:MAG: type secretion system family protein [Deltaproteobacteria bacterium]|nr:type secretion system family protein [Deltaproteobacteria bacterium]
MLWIALLVSVSVLVLVLGVLFLTGISRTEKEEFRKRLSLLRIRRIEDEGVPDFLKSELLSDVPLLNRLLTKFRTAVRIDRRLQQADVPFTVGTFILCSVVLLGAGLVIGFFLNWPLLLSLAVGLLLMYLPTAALNYRKRRRMTRFTELLPDTLEMFSRSLRAGHSFTGALQLVSQEMPAPVGPEFQKVFDEQNLGIPMRQALIDLTERVDIMDLRFFVTAILIQRDTGGNLAEIIDKISYVIRERFRVQGQLRIFTAQARMTGLILVALPPLLAFAIYILNPGYLMPLLTDPLGHVFITVAAILQIAGTLVIRKIIRIKI